ncbi:hypothetical protein MKL09_02730 [Methylobacterium sp. J-048]|uniref:hypothetical protein n=1 Tax=Methylobacterium sp. J-048 TaxID=2836635 RepID=UPI001FBAC77C|nr:hypothetical protein [Methylobacterium sp. J-048]MCJ2055462.1 hypothetical protein [Methylobacterium sp. J-048]
MKTDQRKLPESLTCYLAAPQGAVVETARLPAERGIQPGDQGSAHHALESALLRGFVYVTSGLVWILLLGLVVRHVVR